MSIKGLRFVEKDGRKILQMTDSPGLPDRWVDVPFVDLADGKDVLDKMLDERPRDLSGQGMINPHAKHLKGGKK